MSIYLDKIIRQELAIPTVIVDENMLVTGMIKSNGEEVPFPRILEVAKFQDISLKQAFFVILSDTHTTQALLDGNMSQHYLDTLSVLGSGSSQRWDVDLYIDMKLTKSFVGEDNCRVVAKYDSILIKVVTA